MYSISFSFFFRFHISVEWIRVRVSRPSRDQHGTGEVIQRQLPPRCCSRCGEGVRFCTAPTCWYKAVGLNENPLVSSTSCLTTSRGGDWSPARVDQRLSSSMSLAVHLLHVECECRWLDAGKSSSAFVFLVASEPAWYKYASFCLHCKWQWIRSSRLQVFFSFWLRTHIQWVLFLDSFRAQPEKEAFLPQKSDGSKTPQFTDVSLSCVRRPQYVVFLFFSGMFWECRW